MGGSNSIINVANTTIDLNEYKCSDRGLILPIISEYTWPIWIRIVLYLAGLLYLFLAIAKVADIFMTSIEKITSKTTYIKYPDPNNPTGPLIDREVKIWNDTVANLTLMALGSSAPEILLSCIEIVGNNFLAGELGPGTIVGSAAYNLLVISALCVVAIDGNEIRRIKNYTVFLTTAAWSVFAYLWLFIVLVVITPNEVTIWEAVVTFMSFPTLVIHSYIAEKNFFIKKKQSSELEEGQSLSEMSGWQRKKLFEDQAVSAEEILEYSKDFADRTDITDDEKAKLLAAMILRDKEKSRIHYRINGVRQLTGSRKNEIELPAHLEKLAKRKENAEYESVNQNIDVRINGEFIKDLSENGAKSVIEFAASSYAVLENEQVCRIMIERYGKMDQDVTFRVETIDGTAEAGEDYNKIDEIITMTKNQRHLPIDLTIIDDNQWEPDETFFVKISLYGDQHNVKVGHKAICMVTIIDDDEPGEIEFSQPVYVVKESIGTFEVTLERKNGADGSVSVGFKTSDINAIGDKDYITKNGVLDFKHGEITKTIPITIIDDKTADKDESFAVELFDPKGGVKIGRISKTVVTIINDDDMKNIAARMANMVNADLDAISVVKKGWVQQFREELNVNGGDEATAFDYVMHVLSFPWKVLFCFLPPAHIWGGWLCFFCSLAVIGVLTAIVGDAAAIFGCLVGLKDSVTAITFVALGTSLPDTFASKIAAKNEKTADNAIGNVTGSNSVNVFLGLGLPWVIASIYWAAKGLPFTVKAGSLTFSVAVYTCVSFVALGLIFIRRFSGWFGKGELGGPSLQKYLSTFILISLWIIYIVLSSLQAYGHIPF